MAKEDDALYFESLITLLDMLEKHQRYPYEGTPKPQEYINCLPEQSIKKTREFLTRLNSKGVSSLLVGDESDRIDPTLPSHIATNDAGIKDINSTQGDESGLGHTGILSSILDVVLRIDKSIPDELVKIFEGIASKNNLRIDQQFELLKAKVDNANRVKNEVATVQNNESIQKKFADKVTEIIYQNIEKMQNDYADKLDKLIQDKFGDKLSGPNLINQESIQNDFSEPQNTSDNQVPENNQSELAGETSPTVTQEPSVVPVQETVEPNALLFEEVTTSASAPTPVATASKAQNIRDLIFSAGDETEATNQGQNQDDVLISDNLKQTIDSTVNAYNNADNSIYQMMRLNLLNGEAWADNPRPFIDIQSARQLPLKEIQGNATFLGAEGEGKYWLVMPKKNMGMNYDACLINGCCEFFEFVPPLGSNSNAQRAILVEPAIFEKVSEGSDNVYYLVKRGKVKVEI